MQIVPAAVQAWLGQQASPAAPHAMVDVLVEVTVTVTVLVPVFVPVALAVRVAVLVCVVVMVRPPELLEQAEAEATTSTNVTTQRAARADETTIRFVLIENPPGALQNQSTTR
jgi:MFS superfamily sulfate permease-like transporter